MVLTILLAWLVLAALAAVFLYCCSRVSEGPTGELADDDFAAEPAASTTLAWAIPEATERRFAPPGQ